MSEATSRARHAELAHKSTIWVASDGIFHEASLSTLKLDQTGISFDFNLAELSGVTDLIAKYQINAKENPSATVQSTSTRETWQTTAIQQAWDFSHEVEIGDLLVLGRRGTMYVGRISGPYTFKMGNDKGIHTYSVEPVTELDNKFQHPWELWHLFNNTRFGKVSDPVVQQLLLQSIAGALLPGMSKAHLLFEEMLRKGGFVDELVDDYVSHPTVKQLEHCERCGSICTEVIYVEDFGLAINHPDGWFVSWEELSGLKEHMQEGINEGWLKRLPGESDLRMAQRYIDEREDLESYLASSSRDAGATILFGFRHRNEELWTQLFVINSWSGFVISSPEKLFPTRALAEQYFHELGFRLAADINAVHLETLGFTDPEGQHLTKESND